MSLMVEATVRGARRLGDYIVLSFHAPSIASAAVPGQFVNIALEPGGACILRRPFSIYEADASSGDVSVAFDAIGSGTRWLSTRFKGQTLDVVGPLGTGFTVEPGPALLVGGGYGTAALTFLARALPGPVHAIVGARSASRLFIDDALRSVAASITVTTDDGSAGTRGVVTDVMPAVIAEHGIQTVYACGPNVMLKAVGTAAGVPTQLAVEEFMACGIGVCWTCVVPVRANGSVAHSRVCTEGPVFEGAALAWA